MKQSVKATPLIFLIGISSILIILARTELLQPLMQFIQADQVNNLQIIACIVFSIAGLWLTFILLNIISKFYINKLAQVTCKSTGSLSNHSTNHGGEKK